MMHYSLNTLTIIVEYYLLIKFVSTTTVPFVMEKQSKKSDKT